MAKLKLQRPEVLRVRARSASAKCFLRKGATYREGFVTATLSSAHAGRARHVSCCADGILPLCSSFGSEDPQCGSGDQMALKVEGVVNCAVHAEETLGGSG